MENTPTDDIRKLFEAVLELEPAARQARLAALTIHQPDLRAAVEELLAEWEQAGDFLEAPALFNLATPSAVAALAEPLTAQIGAYRLLKKIGQGGMSEVYLAERTDNLYDKQVAVKLVWTGGQSTEMARRFDRERRILATLEHPHIARLLDGGRTEAGQPYVVMEYVDGQPLTDYCQSRKLPLPQRLKLFQMVCEAVKYAHQHLIVHRDLKPSNIFVTQDGAIKLLDFGIAKLLDPGANDDVAAAEPSTMLNFATPEYASPEHLRGERITTASDVYSLGVLLYEVLTGVRPFQFPTRSLPEVLRVLETADPARPSQAVLRQPALSADLPETPERLSKLLRGDLDNIVLKALQKEPVRRYPSPRQLSEDLARHLNGEPVVAREATLAYRLGKRIRRNKALSAGLALIALALLTGLFITRQQLQAARARDWQQQRELYAANIRQAGYDWTERNLARANESVARYLPRADSSVAEMRGFEWYFLWNALHPTYQSFTTRNRPNEFLISPDASHLYVGMQNGAIELWNLATWQFERTVAQQPTRLRALARDAKAALLASSGEDGVVCVWETATGKPVLNARLPNAVRIHSAAFTPAGDLLAVGGVDGKVYVWDVASAKLRVTLQYSDKWVQGLTFSPDGSLLAVAGTGDSTVKLWETRTFRLVRALSGSQYSFYALSFTPDGQQLAAVNRDSQVLFWSVANGQLLQTLTGNQADRLWSLDFSPDGKTVVVAGGGRVIRLWDWSAGRERARINVDAEISTIKFLPQLDRQVLLATLGSDVRLFDFQQLKLPVSALPTVYDPSALALSPDERILAYGDNAGRLTLHPASGGPPLTVPLTENLSIEAVLFSPSGQTLALAYGVTADCGVVELRDPATGQLRQAAGPFNYYVNHLDYAPDGQTLATANGDGTLVILDSATLAPRLTIKTGVAGVKKVFYAPTGDRLLSFHLDEFARVWDLRTGAKLLEVPSLMISPFSPDGRYFASADRKNNITIYNAATGQAIHQLKGHSDFPFCMVFSPDSRRLASAGDDLSVRLWAVETGLELVALKEHTRRITGLLFAPDGQTLYTGAKDKTLRIWRSAAPATVVPTPSH